jgi:MoaA/NifB/PqqE/SkfB family radical SAM enzyme
MTEACPYDCFHCFTDKNKQTLTLQEIKSVIDQLEKAKTYSIDFTGEGEPTIDRHFFDILEYTASKGIQFVVFTDAATKLRDEKFVKRLYDTGASAAPKCDSLFNAEYQNWVVGDKKGTYFKQRNEAIKHLIDAGFNEVQEDGTTRLGFNMVVTKKNIHEIEKTLRYCRDNNLWIIFVNYIPSGRCAKHDFDRSLMLDEQQKIKLRDIVKSIDEEYGLYHGMWNNFATMPCIEFMQIFGDGRVSPCAGNEYIIGNVKTDSIATLKDKILERFPNHNRATFDGQCLYRPRF